ncbi:uncharacterized protein LOC136770941 [Amia ocellicauda]|uniref:uncharacterized protein LOC136770941 n=1 Tax=Amia ocellicauda TaxID=2972642 RepID=UPI003464CCDE
MFLVLLIIHNMMRTVLCEVLSCEQYLNRRVAGVFRYDRGSRYNLTFQQAKTACEKDFGATLADRHQLYAAYEGGLNECRAGWISSAEAAYPRVHKNWKCGQNQTGIITYGIRQNIQETWDVFCYKEDSDCSAYHILFSSTQHPKEREMGAFANITGSGNTSNNLENRRKVVAVSVEDSQTKQDTENLNNSNPVTVALTDMPEMKMFPSGPSETNGLSRAKEELLNIKDYQNKEMGFEKDSVTKNPFLQSMLSSVPKGEEELLSSKMSSTHSTASAQIFTVRMKNTTLQSPVTEVKIIDGKSETESLSNQNIYFDVSDPFRPVMPSLTIKDPEKESNNKYTQANKIGVMKVSSKEYDQLEPIRSTLFHSASTTQRMDNKDDPANINARNGSNVKHQSKRLHEESSGRLSHFTTSPGPGVFTKQPLLEHTQLSGNGVLMDSKDSEKLLASVTSVASTDENTETSKTTLDLSSPADKKIGTAPFSALEEGEEYEYKTITVMAKDSIHKKLYETSVENVLAERILTVSDKPLSVVTGGVGNDEFRMESATQTIIPSPSNEENTEFSQTSTFFLNSGVHEFDKSKESLDKEAGSVLPAAVDEVSVLGGGQSLDKPLLNGNKIADISTVQTLDQDQLSAANVHSSDQYNTLISTTIVMPSSLQPTLPSEDYYTRHNATSGSEIQTSLPAQTSDIELPPLPWTAAVTHELTDFSKTSVNWISTHSPEEYSTKLLHDTETMSYPKKPDPTLTLKSAGAQPEPTEIVLTGRTRKPEGTTVITTSQESTVACGGVLNGLEGEFQSPGFGHSYQSDMDCTWEISAPAGHLILLTFQSFVLEEHRSCKYDSVTVFDGRKAEEQELGRFCGSELPPLLRSTSSSMIVQMKSDSSLQLDGFSAHFRSIKSPSGSVGLKGGRNQMEGLVEVDFNGKRGRLCAKQWDANEAAVVCRQLGFTGTAVSTSVSEKPSDPAVALSYVNCSGDETSLDECEVRWGGECGTTERAAVYCQVMETCAALRNAGVLESATYVIDPDGEGQGVEPFPVHCDMDSQPATGVTEVGHNGEGRVRVSPCEEAGCYSRKITYNKASLQQLRSLIEASESCTQHVRLDCRHIRFLGQEWGWWVSWDGRRVDSWGSASPGSKKCDCGERGNCDLGLLTCNCDANDEVWRSDGGLLSDQKSLPVSEVRFGDTRDIPMEMAFHTIGKLRCTGQKERDPVFESCATLKQAGFVESGRYVIDPDGAGQGVAQFEVHCDMTSDPLTGVTLVSHDSENRLRAAPCEDKGCYRREVQYEAGLAQLKALTQISKSCQQYVKLDCRHTRFIQAGWGWWVSWDGQKRFDWGGAERNSGSCACGMTGTCFGTGRLCNCDSNDHIWRMDEGFVRDKTSLPIKAVHLGDTKEAPLEMAFHTIGKLICKGRI